MTKAVIVFCNSVFSGDLIQDSKSYLNIIKSINSQLNVSIEPYKSDYFILLISNISKKQKEYIDYNLKNEEFYIGAMNWTFRNEFLKSGLLLPAQCLKLKNNIIMPSVEKGYVSMLEEFLSEYNCLYIPEYLYSRFLTYNYFLTVYSINKNYALNFIDSDNPTPIPECAIRVDDDKFYRYMQTKKNHVLKIMGISDKQDFINAIKNSISNHIFNIELNSNVLKFNTVIDEKNQRFYFSFEYLKSTHEIRLITAY